jgi:hypothetical protein
VDALIVGLCILSVTPLLSLWGTDIRSIYPAYLLWGRSVREIGFQLWTKALVMMRRPSPLLGRGEPLLETEFFNTNSP